MVTQRKKIVPDSLWEIQPGRAATLAGTNFSGRTRLLRCWTGIEEWDGHNNSTRPKTIEPAAYIGPEVYNAISGLSATVTQELTLHSGNGIGRNPVQSLADQLGLTHLYDRNPFTLSGGEQTCLTIVSALALQPRALAIDCPTEQLDFELKLRLLRWMNNGMASNTATVLADNRLAEFEKEFPTVLQLVGDNTIPDLIHRARFESINPDACPRTSTAALRTLSIEALVFGYPKCPALLRQTSVRLQPNVYILDGRNGAGKSTLAKLLCGVLKPSGGRILVDHTEARPWKQPGHVVAYHFQNPDLQLFSTSVEDEILAGPHALGLDACECAQRADEMIKTFGLSNVRKEHPLDLPFVIRKRIALAATLAMGRPWTILDEPTLGQDDNASDALAQIVANFRSLGMGIIVITHSQSFRQRLSCRVLRLQDGFIEQSS